MVVIMNAPNILVECELVEKLVLGLHWEHRRLSALGAEALEVLEVLRWVVVLGRARLEALVFGKILVPGLHGILVIATELTDGHSAPALDVVGRSLYGGGELRVGELRRWVARCIEGRLGLLPVLHGFGWLERV